MALSKTEKTILESEARAVYEAYQVKKGQIEQVIRSRVAQEVAAEQGDALRELSRTMHDFHRKGLPKSALRVATKKYGNNDEFLKIWNAYEPDEPFTLAVGRQSIPVFEWRDKILYVLKNPATGETFSQEIAVPLYSRKGWYLGTFPEHVERQVNTHCGGRSEGLKVYLAVVAEIKRAFEEGEISESTDPYDYVNDLPKEQQESFLEREDRKNYTYNPWMEEENA